ncbi:MAG: permease [Spirochaetaceae bacterium]|jgi:uncharacterized membrane protein YraQ (UPF0718 family)|nr:permease [Spirochaetaceae bacterium]
MNKLFKFWADFWIYRVAAMDMDSSLGQSLHFFIEDTSKIFVLLLLMIYIISWLRAGLDMFRIRGFLQGKGRLPAYIMASFFGAITPFCSCSSIPLFLGFTSAGIPLGITMAFLITSPMINEVALVLLGSTLGLKFLLIYTSIGMTSGILGGWFLDSIKAERYLTDLGARALNQPSPENQTKQKMTGKQRHQFAIKELKEIFSRVWIWILIGVGIGALLHGFVPENFFTEHLGKGQLWTVPAAVILGIPLYANASGVIPVVESLINKGVPIGTAMAFMMSVVGASFPEFMMLKQVMKPRLLLLFFLILMILFSVAGWALNYLL